MISFIGPTRMFHLHSTFQYLYYFFTIFTYCLILYLGVFAHFITCKSISIILTSLYYFILFILFKSINNILVLLFISIKNKSQNPYLKEFYNFNYGASNWKHHFYYFIKSQYSQVIYSASDLDNNKFTYLCPFVSDFSIFSPSIVVLIVVL